MRHRGSSGATREGVTPAGKGLSVPEPRIVCAATGAPPSGTPPEIDAQIGANTIFSDSARDEAYRSTKTGLYG
jgi:hypothetical protein